MSQFISKSHVAGAGNAISVQHLNIDCARVDFARRLFVQLVLPLLLAIGYCGCAQPLRVDTRADVQGFADINGNINGNIKAELSPTPRLQPVTASGLPHRNFDPSAAVVAVVDVDGLLLNSDATGLGSWGENPVSA